MSATAQSERDIWVERVLGMRSGGDPAGDPLADPAAGLGTFRRDWAAALAGWQTAVETVDGQMTALGAELRATGDAWLAQIADLGLNAMTANHKVRATAACMFVTQAADEKLVASAAAARKVVGAFAEHVAGNAQIASCDTNPFGVTVTIRATLGPALKTLADTLASAGR